MTSPSDPPSSPSPQRRPALDVIAPRRREIDRLLDELKPLFADGDKPLPARLLLDIVETPGGLKVSAEVPGMAPADLDVTVQDYVLTVSGRKPCDCGAGEGKVCLAECGHGDFTRAVELPAVTDIDAITAHISNGMLTIEAPYRIASSAKTIPVTQTP